MSLDENPTGGNATAAQSPVVQSLRAPASGIELWSCTLRASPAEIEAYRNLLSAAEHARAARFGTVLLRERYVIGRAALRGVLGRVLGVDAASVPIVRGSRGRPQLPGEATLDFNVSHTHDRWLVGVLRDARSSRIGVDVECLDRRINVSGLARKFLSEAERAMLSGLDAEEARRRVLALWTCKEAMSKATGEALSAPFSQIHVDVLGAPALRDGPEPYRAGRWSLHRASVHDRYVATVAVWQP